MNLFSDPCLALPKISKKYTWFYDEHLNLFCVLPKREGLSQVAQQLWDAFIACMPVIQKQSLHDFQWSIDSLDGLLLHCKPQRIWLCIDEPLPKRLSHLNYSPSPQAWLTHPLLKKQVWQLWQKILNSRV